MDTSNVYAVTEYGSVVVVPRMGGPTATIPAARPANTENIVADGTQVFWATKGNCDSSTGAIYRLAKGSLTPEPIVTGPQSGYLRLDAMNLYAFSSSACPPSGEPRAILVLDKSTGATTRSVPVSQISGSADVSCSLPSSVGGSYIFFCNNGAIIKTDTSFGARTVIPSPTKSDGYGLMGNLVVWLERSPAETGRQGGKFFGLDLQTGEVRALGETDRMIVAMSIAKDETSLFFLHAAGSTSYGGALEEELMQLVPGLPLRSVAKVAVRGFTEPEVGNGIIADGHRVYWTSSFLWEDALGKDDGVTLLHSASLD